VEPAGLGVPPYLSSYVRYAYSSLLATKHFNEISYATIDDFRVAVGLQDTDALIKGYTDRLTYSLTKNAPYILDILQSSELVVVIAGDAVPSVHLHAVNGSTEEISQALSYAKGQRIVVGPAANYLRSKNHPFHNLFKAFHNQTFAPDNLLVSSTTPISYEELNQLISSFEGLLSQIPWPVISEMDLYRGCTRRNYCSFCNEPVKNREVVFREPQDIIREVELLYQAGVKHFRLGQQACFFSYFNGNLDKISQLLEGIRERCPEILVLHIDNVDPLVAASTKGRKIAKCIATYCTEGNCAPMGIESFDPAVVQRNHLTVTPEVLVRAISNIEEFGSEIGSLGQRKLLPGLNLIYGLPGETRRTHFENMRWLIKILEEGHFCHRTNVRQLSVYEGTELNEQDISKSETFDEDFNVWKRDIAELYDLPMKKRVYPAGQVLRDLHSFFVNEEGTWFRRLGSYPIMVIEPEQSIQRYEKRDLVITKHAGRYIYGRVLEP
jgi:radical SAM superfamily enzyme with C-terminal helix-hairpin-helix motif